MIPKLVALNAKAAAADYAWWKCTHPKGEENLIPRDTSTIATLQGVSASLACGDVGGGGGEKVGHEVCVEYTTGWCDRDTGECWIEDQWTECYWVWET